MNVEGKDINQQNVLNSIKKKNIDALMNEDKQNPFSDIEQTETKSIISERGSSSEDESDSYIDAIINEEKIISNIELIPEKNLSVKIKKLPVKKSNNKGGIHKTGETNITNIICNKYKIKCLIHGGAFCSIISPKLLDKISPGWKSKLIPVKPAKSYSSNSKLNPMGILTLDIIFPHIKNNIQITVELIVMEDFRMKYIILRNNYMINY
jgi:hypothetical protein